MPETDLSIPGGSALITAAGSGIGREIARRLLESGVDVVINDVDEEALESASQDLEGTDGRLVTIQGDAGRPADVTAAVEEAVQNFGTLDILVNNVGISGPTKPLEEIAPSTFMETVETNLGGHFAAISAAGPYLRDGGPGRIVSLSSISGKQPLDGRTPYTASKMGVIGLTRTAAVEMASDNITVNAICPGSVDGPRLEQVIEGQAENQGRPVEEVKREFRERSPMNEFVTQTDVADLVLFLCSENASHITGQDLNVSAGVCMH
ncbi:MAG: SDR family NAD(P)-dependent oxidoreductase [Halodesulfurarchaeum sp.]